MEATLLRLIRYCTRPTLLAQGATALGALILVTAATRQLTPKDYGTYAAVMATYMFGTALVATTIGTRNIEAISTASSSKIEVTLRQDCLPVTLCILAAASSALLISHTAVIAAWSMLGMCAMLVSEVCFSYALGHQRYVTFSALLVARTVGWVGVAVLCLIVLSPGDRLGPVLASPVAGAAIPAIYVLVLSGARFRSSSSEHTAPISAVGVANLGLWLLASADRVILGRMNLGALATYAALYGLLDRIFRSIANAEIQSRLPAEFRRRQNEGFQNPRLKPLRVLASLALACLTAIASPEAIRLISGGRYHPSYLMAVVLSLGMAAMVIAVPSFVALLASNRGRRAAVVAWLAALTNIVGNIFLIPIWQAEACAALTLIGYLIWLVGVATTTTRSPDTASLQVTSKDPEERMLLVEEFYETHPD